MEAEASITGLGPTKDARVSKDSNIIAAIPPERGFRACIECRRKKTRCMQGLLNFPTFLPTSLILNL
ncbi:hypothetical protein CLIM01_04491 [Colletotrichum limetticola]|uniref:Uncharacterized protein n=1 Tax=Colletotrichum limetticola TaxID=1209924 RepID=A0ABQ9Q2V7_9PEZI|nr:hypothetical protein CLIM01_04491 [Colletotrichum limetticola]